MLSPVSGNAWAAIFDFCLHELVYRTVGRHDSRWNAKKRFTQIRELPAAINFDETDIKAAEVMQGLKFFGCFSWKRDGETRDAGGLSGQQRERSAALGHEGYMPRNLSEPRQFRLLRAKEWVIGISRKAKQKALRYLTAKVDTMFVDLDHPFFMQGYAPTVKSEQSCDVPGVLFFVRVGHGLPYPKVYNPDNLLACDIIV